MYNLKGLAFAKQILVELIYKFLLRGFYFCSRLIFVIDVIITFLFDNEISTCIITLLSRFVEEFNDFGQICGKK